MKFEESNKPTEIEDLFRAKIETTRKKEKTLREIGSRKAAIGRDEVSISKVKRDEAKGSSTTEGSKERLYELNWEEENKTLYYMIRELEQMLKEQKEYSASLRKENRQQTLGQGQVSKTDDV